MHRQATPGADSAEKRVAPLELFFDLVFVFALTQVTQLMSEEPTWTGLGQGMLVLAALWWAWGAYAWLTNYIAAEEDRERLLMVAVMGAFLVAALAVPGAFGDDAVLFAVAYALARWLHRASRLPATQRRHAQPPKTARAGRLPGPDPGRDRGRRDSGARAGRCGHLLGDRLRGHSHGETRQKVRKEHGAR